MMIRIDLLLLLLLSICSIGQAAAVAAFIRPSTSYSRGQDAVDVESGGALSTDPARTTAHVHALSSSCGRRQRRPLYMTPSRSVVSSASSSLLSAAGDEVLVDHPTKQKDEEQDEKERRNMVLWKEEAMSTLFERTGSRDVEIRLPQSFTPLERIAISAEGDLQRIISSYYNSAVTVTIKHCLEVEPGLFDREVDLSVFGKVFATASSRLEPKTSQCMELVRGKKLGLGQLFRHLKVYPDFHLLNVGKNAQGFWRLYQMDCPGILTCRILEQFELDTFQRLPPSSSTSSAPSITASGELSPSPSASTATVSGGEAEAGQI